MKLPRHTLSFLLRGADTERTCAIESAHARTITQRYLADVLRAFVQAVCAVGAVGVRHRHTQTRLTFEALTQSDVSIFQFLLWADTCHVCERNRHAVSFLVAMANAALINCEKKIQW